jgi:hypothetical protein
MGSFYRSQHEFISVHKKGRAAHRNNIQLGRHGRSRTNNIACRTLYYPTLSTVFPVTPTRLSRAAYW